MLCADLAAALLLGLLANAAFAAWWLDPIVGLLIATVAVRGLRDLARRGLLLHRRPAGRAVRRGDPGRLLHKTQ